MVMVLDARTGLAFEHADVVAREMSAASAAFGRFDSAHGAHVPGSGSLDQYRQRCDAKFVADLQEQMKRNDALVGRAGAFPRDFEHIYREILLEKRRPNNWSTCYRTDSRVPLGAKKHTVRRRLGHGEAKIHRGGEAVPLATGSMVEEEFKIIYIVCGVETNWFELVSDSFEGRNQFADDTRMAIRLIEEKMNRIFFNGDAASAIYGSLNYPHMAKSVSPVAMTSSGTAAAQVAELNRIANFAQQQSGGVFAPNRMKTSIRIRNYLFQTQNSLASDKSIGQFFLDGHQSINEIEGIHEMRGIGPNSEDGIMAYDDSLESTAAVVVQPPTALPAHAMSSFKSQLVYVAAIGGIVMRDVGNNHLALAAGV